MSSRVSKLRASLEEMGYTEPLSGESVHLVEHLVRDLVSARDSLQNYTLKSSALTIEQMNLSKENDKVKDELVKTVSKLEHANKDLRLLNSHYMHKIRTMEKDSTGRHRTISVDDKQASEAYEKISSILGRVETEREVLVSELKKDFQDIRSMRDSTAQKTGPAACSVNCPAAAERMKMESEMAELEQKIIKSEAVIISLEDELNNLKKTSGYYEKELRNKETELARVSLLLKQANNAQAELKTRMQGNLVDMEEKLVRQEKSMYKLNSSFGTMQRERDSLQKNINDKTKTISNLEKDLKGQSTSLLGGGGGEINSKEFQETKEALEKEIRTKQHEITRLTKAVCSLEIEMDIVLNSNDELERHNAQLKNDITLLKKRASRHNEKALGAFKKKVEDYVGQIAYLHRMLLDKEYEKEEWLHEYIRSSDECTTTMMVTFDLPADDSADSICEQDTDELVEVLSELPVCEGEEVDENVEVSYKEAVTSYITSKY